MSETKRERRIRIQRERAKKKNRNFWQRKNAVEIRNSNSFKKQKQAVIDQVSQHQALREIRVDNQQCRLKHIDRRIRGYYRFGRDATASLEEENLNILLENEQSEYQMQSEVAHVATAEIMGHEFIDLTGDDECELTSCITTYDDLERHENQLDEEFGELLSA